MRNIFEPLKMPKKLHLTPARLSALQQGLADGGELIIGGADETVPRPRADVINALLAMGFLKCPVGSRSDNYAFTQKAFNYFKKGS